MSGVRRAVPPPVRWAILGAARIAASDFLPSLRAAGGKAELVAARDGERAAAFAASHGVARSVAGYRAAVEDPRVDAVYVALPNHLHAEWTIAALEAGKAVLCEKPMAWTTAEARAIAQAAAGAERPLWEAFAFLFHPQTRRLEELVRDGAIGDVRTLRSRYHAEHEDRGDIRWSAALGGGALLDLGVYPIRLARLLLGPRFGDVAARLVVTEGGVDVETEAVVEFATGGSLELSASFARTDDTTTAIVGEAGEIRVPAPFTGTAADAIELIRPGREPLTERHGTDRPLFADQLDHIHAVLTTGAPPLMLAAEDVEASPAIVEAIVRAAVRTPEAGPLPLDRSG